MKSTLKSVLALVLLATMVCSFSTGVAEMVTPNCIYALEDVLVQVLEMDSEAIYEIVEVDGISFLDVNWSFGTFGCVELIRVSEEEFVCYGENIMKMMLSCAAGISMEREMLMVF